MPALPGSPPRRLHMVAAVAAVVVLSAALPAAAEEEPVAGDTVVGELVQAWPEAGHAAAHADEGPLTWIQTGDGEAVRVPTEDVDHLPVGATVEVVVGDEVADRSPTAADLEPAVEVLAADVLAAAPVDPPVAAASGGTTNAVTVVMAVPAGSAPDATGLADVVGAVNGPVADFWARQSDGAVRLGVTASFGWFRASAGCGSPYALWNEAAAHAGWRGGPGQHLLVYLPSTATDCSAGLAEVGSTVASGGRLYVRSTVTSVLAHELGHNFGLGHASQLQCDGAVETGACRVIGYADWYDVMGVSWEQLGSLGAPHAARLGLLPPGSAPTVLAGSPPGQFVLSPVGARTGTRAVRLLDSDGDQYWLEYRTPTGQDGWLGSAANRRRLESGVVLRLARDGNDTSVLLDATPSRTAPPGGDPAVALPGGAPVSFGDARFTVRVVEATGAAARIEVASGPSGPALVPAAAPAAARSTEIGGSGSTYLLNDRFTGLADRVFSFGGPLDSVLVGDWNGDGVDTLAVRRGNTFHVREQNTTGVADRSFAYGDPGDAVLVGDWDGDGRDTLAVRRGNSYHVKNSLQTGVADRVLAYGDPDDVVLVGDWDGDGADSLTVRRGATYHVKNGLSTGVADRVFGYGEPQDTVLVGRWSAGQRGDTLAVRRGMVYHLRFSLTSGPADLQVGYGDPSDTAFAGDWNADGVDTLGVRRPG
ncbi:reprolysin-like metallopeptidase [Geodermatophilus sp. SYSU D00079]